MEETFDRLKDRYSSYQFPPEQDYHDHDERVEFALFLKIIIRCLERSKHYFLLRQARLVVKTCTIGHKMGDPNFSPLVDAVEMRLKKLVGDRIWKQARAYTKIYLKRKQNGVRCLPHRALVMPRL